MRTNEENKNMKINGKNKIAIKCKMIRNKIRKNLETLVAVHTHTHTHTHTHRYFYKQIFGILKEIETIVLII